MFLYIILCLRYININRTFCNIIFKKASNIQQAIKNTVLCAAIGLGSFLFCLLPFKIFEFLNAIYFNGSALALLDFKKSFYSQNASTNIFALIFSGDAWQQISKNFLASYNTFKTNSNQYTNYAYSFNILTIFSISYGLWFTKRDLFINRGMVACTALLHTVYDVLVYIMLPIASEFMFDLLAYERPLDALTSRSGIVQSTISQH